MFDESRLASENGVSATVKIKDWFILDLIGLLNIIPVAGSIACLIIYLIIAFSQKTAVSMKNRVLVSFIWALIYIAIMLVFLFAFGGLAILSNVANSYY